MEGKAGRGMAKSNGLWSPLLQALSSSFSQSFPASLHCMLQDEFFVRQCHPLAMRLLPPAPFQGRRDADGRGRWVQTVCSREWEGSTQDWMSAHLPLGSSQPGESLLPSPCWGQLCPLVLHAASQGPPGKGNRKKALRGSRRGAERDSSPFSFTLSFLKGHAKLSRKGNIRTERSIRRRLAGVLPRTGGFQVTDGGK